jgi:hypothetical protein
VVKHLHRICEALGSIPVAQKFLKKRKEGGRERKEKELYEPRQVN